MVVYSFGGAIRDAPRPVFFFKRKMGQYQPPRKRLTFLGSENPGPKNPSLENEFVFLEGGFASTRCSPGTGRETTKSNTLLSKVYPTIDFQVLCEFQGESEKLPN